MSGGLVIGGRIDESFEKRVEALSRKMGRLARMTISVTSVVSASYACQTLFPFLANSGNSYAHIDLLNGLALSSFQLFIVALAIAFPYAGVVDYLFTSRLSRSAKEAKTSERLLKNEMIARELI